MNRAKKSEVQLQLIELNSGGCSYQTLAINLLKPQILITVEELVCLEIPPELNKELGIILYGRAPMWIYSHLVCRFKDLPWVACYDVRYKAAVVIRSYVSQFQPGDILPIEFKNEPGTAILIGGPPGSGKSVFSYSLRVELAAKISNRQIYLHRANWDGEGNHTYETADFDLAKRLREQGKFKIHQHPNAEILKQEYFQYQAESTRNIRHAVDLVLVDIGGMPGVAEIPLIEECGYYIVISKYPEKVKEWHNLCEGKLKPLAVIHSVWEERLEVLQTEPFLEIAAGKWLPSAKVPAVLLDEVLKILP